MIAEIHNKIVDRNSEDQMTGDIFGALRYLPYEVFRTLIVDCVMPVETRESLSKHLPLDAGTAEWGRCVEFWPRYKTDSITEPDIVISLGNVAVMIEAKYGSGESGETQLMRQANLLISQFSDASLKFLLIAAPASTAEKMFDKRKEEIRSSFSKVKFGYIKWERLFDVATKLAESNLICADIAELLKTKSYSGFRGFGMMNTETMGAFKKVYEAHEAVESFMRKCLECAEQNGEFVVAPMSKGYWFLRWNEEKDYRTWAYRSFILAFQCSKDRRYPKSEWRNGPLYVLEISFDFSVYPEPTACIMRYDYESMAGKKTLSVGDHWKFHEPLYYSKDLEQIGWKFWFVSDEPLDRYFGLKQIVGCEIPLSEITEDNVNEMVFERFVELRNVTEPSKWVKKKP